MKLALKALCLVGIAILSGCVTQSGIQSALQEADQKYQLQNQTLTLSLGERNFDFNQQLVIKALVTSFGQYNMAVLNIDSDVGYLVAEGDPLVAPEELKMLAEGHIAYLNELTDGGNPWRYVGNNMVMRATVNIFEREDDFVTVKVSFSNKVTSNTAVVSNAIFSDLLEAMYKNLWADLDKQLFILQETMTE